MVANKGVVDREALEAGMITGVEILVCIISCLSLHYIQYFFN